MIQKMKSNNSFFADLGTEKVLNETELILNHIFKNHKKNPNVLLEAIKKIIFQNNGFT